MAITPLLVSAVFLFGLLVGSFLNVCIWRLPSGEQIVVGRSHCRHCRREIVWYDNIPLLSFILLGGRCRQCRERIEWSYPGVELLTGLLLAAVLVRFGWTPLAAVYGLLGALLILLAFIDGRELILPDEITLPGVSLGAVLSYFLPQMHGVSNSWAGLWASAVGALAGSGVVWVIGVLGTWFFKREAMGFGDVKLMAMVGAFIGWKQVLLVNFILAPFLGAAIGLILKFKYGRDVIPYGPFLGLGTLAAIFFGADLIGWYMGLLGF
ncbi:MAG: prepilin peptidase [Candidatus Omnitrophica bacterium]|nr:prepilin peptidase [Candidatus Omnitrophota bacterium]